jgi:hypothetical protein
MPRQCWMRWERTVCLVEALLVCADFMVSGERVATTSRVWETTILYCDLPESVRVSRRSTRTGPLNRSENCNYPLCLKLNLAQLGGHMFLENWPGK